MPAKERPEASPQRRAHLGKRLRVTIAAAVMAALLPATAASAQSGVPNNSAPNEDCTKQELPVGGGIAAGIAGLQDRVDNVMDWVAGVKAAIAGAQGQPGELAIGANNPLGVTAGLGLEALFGGLPVGEIRDVGCPKTDLDSGAACVGGIAQAAIDGKLAQVGDMLDAAGLDRDLILEYLVGCGDEGAAEAAIAALAPVNLAPAIGPMHGDAGISVSCLGGNGRVDTNIVNNGDATATYTVEFGNLRTRQRIIDAGDWGRVAISGRPDGDHTMRVARDGVAIVETTATVACDGDADVSDVELSIVNSCRAGNGYLLFQFVNSDNDARPYVIEFDNVPNRSTMAQGFGAAVRAVTGRPDGQHGYLVRSGSTIVEEGTVEIDCK